MTGRDLARFVALCRVAIGTGFALAPRLTAPLWIGRMARNPGARFFCRIVGVRDVVLAAGVLASMDDDGARRRWILAGAAADAADLAATVATRDELPPLAAANAIATTAGGIALGLLAYRGQS